MKATIKKRVKGKDVDVEMYVRSGLVIATCPTCGAAMMDAGTGLIEKHLEWHSKKGDV